MFADDLSTVTFEEIFAIVERLEFEPGPFDFKEVLNPSGAGRGDAILSLRRTVCGMANSAGGWIVFGVKDNATEQAARDRIVGIPLGGDLRREFGDKLSGILPEVHFDAAPAAIPVPGKPSHGVFVVRIPVSLRRPHQVSETGIFYRRGDGGAASPMSFYEIRDQLLLTEERGRKLELLRLEITMHRTIAQMIRNQRPHPIQAAMRFDTTTLKSLLPDVVPLLPTDTTLIEALVHVPVGAGMVNRYLDVSNDPVITTFGHANQYLSVTETSMLAALDQLDQMCLGIEQKFNELFGPTPLATLSIPRANPEPPLRWRDAP